MGAFWRNNFGSILLLMAVIVVGVLAVNNMPKRRRELEHLFPLTLVHLNDFHARFEETNLKSNNCTVSERSAGSCIAGIARVYTVIRDLLHKYKHQNAIYLNAGDNFQGTLWYNLLRWEVTAEFIKKLRPAAMTLGNHEFDHTPAGLAPYLASLDRARIPTVVANLELNGEPALLNSQIRRSVVLEVDRRRVGIIGVLYDKTHVSVELFGKLLRIAKTFPFSDDRPNRKGDLFGCCRSGAGRSGKVAPAWNQTNHRAVALRVGRR